MITLLKRLTLIFSYGKELDEILMEKRMNKLMEEQKARKFNLKLCLKHKQEQNKSHYSEHNCDYCKLAKAVYTKDPEINKVIKDDIYD